MTWWQWRKRRHFKRLLRDIEHELRLARAVQFYVENGFLGEDFDWDNG